MHTIGRKNLLFEKLFVIVFQVVFIHSDTGINPRVPEFSGIGPIQSANEDTTVNFLNINMNEFNMENSISQNTDMEILSDEMSKTSINDISQMVSFTFGGSNQSNQRI